MARKEDFSPDQWQLILDIPVMVGISIVGAGQNGAGEMKESMAMTNEFLDTVTSNSGNELILSVVNAWIRDEGKSGSVIRENHSMAGGGNDDLLEATVEMCQQASNLLANECSEMESLQFRQWVMHIGEMVAKAASEGRFKGFGFIQVTEEEKIAITKISEALDIEVIT